MTFEDVAQLATTGGGAGIGYWLLQQGVPTVRKWLADRGSVSKTEAKASVTTAETHKIEAQTEHTESETTGKVVAYAVKAAEREAAAAEATDLALQNERMVRLGLEARRDAQDKAIDKLRAECEERDRACQERDRLCMERDAVQDRELAVQAEKIRHLEAMGAQLLARWKDTPR